MKILKVALIILIAVSMVGLAYAATTNLSIGNKSSKGKATATDAKACKPGAKAERGIKNILFGWTEIPKSIIQVTRDTKNPFWGLLGGTIKGFGKAFPRTISGAADLVSFPMASYDKMPVKPDAIETQIK